MSGKTFAELDTEFRLGLYLRAETEQGTIIAFLHQGAMKVLINENPDNEFPLRVDAYFDERVWWTA
jgi:hypothetical protein